MEDGKPNKNNPEIKPIHLKVLAKVRIEPLSATDLGHSLKRDHNYMLHISGHMKQLGLVTLKQGTEDRRKKFLVPTRSGLVILGISIAKKQKQKTMMKKLNDEIEDGLKQMGFIFPWGP